MNFAFLISCLVIISACLLGTGNAKPMLAKDSSPEEVLAPEELHLNEKSFDPYEMRREMANRGIPSPTFIGW